VNVPLGMGYGDADFSRIFVEVLEPIADLYKPQLVLVSAGFDTHFDDPLGGMKMTLDGYATLTGIIQHITRKHTEAKLLLTLEGGYSLSGLRDSVRAVIEQLAGTRQAEDETAEITGLHRYSGPHHRNCGTGAARVLVMLLSNPFETVHTHISKSR